VVLGLFPDAAFATEHGPVLECGDLLVLFTDGVTEAEAPDGTMCGEGWALDVVRTHAHRSAAEILEALCDAVKVFADGSPQHDDVTAIVCRVRD
jgi:sigma-B regulation protein RsbU (phosphoserine phosphatase)